MIYSRKLFASTIVTVATLLSASTLYAGMNVTGSIPVSIPAMQTHKAGLLNASNASSVKEIQLLKVELSKDSLNYLGQSLRSPTFLGQRLLRGSSTPSASLGMNNVPVLDQHQWGSCVSFATTGAIDAAIANSKTSDYISQLCELELGIQLQITKAEAESGWEGATADVILHRMSTYGVIAKTSEVDGCGKLTSYPFDSSSINNFTYINGQKLPGTGMTVGEYKQHRQYDDSTMKQVSISELLNHNDAFSDKTNPEIVLQNVKQALSNGHRVSFGVIVDIGSGSSRHPITHVGIFGKYKASSPDYDSWVITNQIIADINAVIAGTVPASSYIAGHEMIITGYDDNAIINAPYTDENGVYHSYQQGVLTLRNSWGANDGYNGEYYMSYLYFMLLSDEAYAIGPASPHA